MSGHDILRMHGIKVVPFEGFYFRPHFQSFLCSNVMFSPEKLYFKHPCKLIKVNYLKLNLKLVFIIIYLLLLSKRSFKRFRFPSPIPTINLYITGTL